MDDSLNPLNWSGVLAAGILLCLQYQTLAELLSTAGLTVPEHRSAMGLLLDYLQPSSMNRNKLQVNSVCSL